jgi:hypothetical protein
MWHGRGHQRNPGVAGKFLDAAGIGRHQRPKRETVGPDDGSLSHGRLLSPGQYLSRPWRKAIVNGSSSANKYGHET